MYIYIYIYMYPTFPARASSAACAAHRRAGAVRRAPVLCSTNIIMLYHFKINNRY